MKAIDISRYKQDESRFSERQKKECQQSRHHCGVAIAEKARLTLRVVLLRHLGLLESYHGRFIVLQVICIVCLEYLLLSYVLSFVGLLSPLIS